MADSDILVPTSFDRAHGVHYACGRRVLPGWVNVDSFDPQAYPPGWDYSQWESRHLGQQEPEPVYRLDLTRPHTFPDNVFAAAFCEDFMEHLTQADCLRFLAEVYRTLRPGAYFWFCVPCLSTPDQPFRHGANARLREYLYHRWDRWGHKVLFTRDFITVVAAMFGFVTDGLLRGADLRKAGRAKGLDATDYALDWLPTWSRLDAVDDSLYARFRKPLA